ncbi:MAG: hypothetical protein KC592_04850 [Nitrospira sp.]|nr:hypothetical protein [Nitrospira sp.]HBP90171.1 hypothetical protein [Nitrospiraceae bacterium]HNP27725.1 hypothetical protein [Nitrospirales bacterium]
MKQVLSAVLAVVFVVGLVGMSTAGMMDTLKGKAEEAKEASSQAQAHEAMGMKGAEKEQAIEAQGATTQEEGGMMDQVKESAKEKTNETIDNIGK